MAAILDDEIPLLTETVTAALPSVVSYGPREDIPRKRHEALATVGGCLLAMVLLFVLLR
jgi:hypothetical protein